MAKFMYVYRNCLDFYKKLPGEYPWGSGNIYFSEHKPNPADHRIGDILSPEFQNRYNALKRKHFGMLSQYDFQFDITDYEKQDTGGHTVRHDRRQGLYLEQCRHQCRDSGCEGIGPDD